MCAYSLMLSHCLRISLTYVTFAMKIMAGRINMTQAQLTALINERVAAALAAAHAGGISCSPKLF